MKKILVTNDDGIGAAGLEALVEALTATEDVQVYVFAPAEEQSGKSQSITFLRPVRIEECEFDHVEKAYAVDGTPTDCVKVGLAVLKKEGIKPDYVISGINIGFNSGLAAYYSGTVAGAREGALHKIPSIALSVGAHNVCDFSYLQGMLPALLEMSLGIRADVLLNVNAPSLPADEVKGYKAVEAAPYGYGVDYIFEELEEDLFQMGGEFMEQGEGPEYDIDANEAGYVSIAPVPTSMSDEESLDKLKNFLL